MWEKMITEETWARIVSETIDKLRTMQCKDAYEYLGFGVCSLVDQASSRTREPVLIPLQKGLNTFGRQRLDENLFLTLWYKDIQSATYHSLATPVQDAAESALNSATTTQGSIETLLYKPTGSRMEAIPQDQREDMVLHYFQIWVNFIRDNYDIQRVEEKPSIIRHLLNFFHCGFWYGSVVKDSRSLWENMIGPCNLPASTEMTMRASVVLANFCTIVCTEKILRRNTESDEAKYLDVENRRRAQVAALYSVTQSPLCDKNELLLGALKAWHGPEDWKFCLQECVNREIGSMVKEIAASVGELAIYMPTIIPQPDEEVGGNWWKEEGETEEKPQRMYPDTGGILPTASYPADQPPTRIPVADIDMIN
ncbi:unnamed protein product [Rhizoctonia solani]|uniref:Uncharacterized protein n=1 Tax=Rhizoctonia solani TaxID=456999 RepID=A0A8H3GQI7_9AGAM|nr:unnamed protein product [Rhizoctonia solani]